MYHLGDEPQLLFFKRMGRDAAVYERFKTETKCSASPERNKNYVALHKLVSMDVDFACLSYQLTNFAVYRSWNLLGVWFSTSAYISWSDGNAPKWTFRLAVISWEIAAPCTLLVAAVVRYVLWPAALKKDPPIHALNSVRNILMHNMNVLMAVTECFFLSGMPVRWSDCSLAPLWGCVYVVFAWSISTSWVRREDGPQFLYFFFDTTVPGFTPSIALVFLLIVLLTFYGLFCSAEELTHYLGSGLAARFGLGGLLCFGVMRFKD